MQILNGKSSTLMFKLDNGELMRVKSGELSRSFIPSVFQLQAIIAMGSPKEIAIILSSTYEMDVLRQLNGSIAYLQSNEQAAREFLFEGKEPEVEVLPTDNVELLKLKELISDKDKTINELTESLNQVKDELANSPINEYVNKLKLSEEKVSKLEELVSNTNSELDAAKKESLDLLKELDEVKKAKDESDLKLKEANDKLVEVTDDHEKVELLQKENNQLKEDGSKLVDNYKKAKEALLSVMQKFGIEYENGDYVMKSSKSAE